MFSEPNFLPHSYLPRNNRPEQSNFKETASLSSKNDVEPDASPDSDEEGRSNHFERSKECHSPPEVVSPARSYFRNVSPPSRYYDSEEEAIRKLKRSLPKQNGREQNFYTYVPIGSHDIRLMLLSPGEQDDTIYCSLKTMPVDKIKRKKLRFQALSYCWGEDLPTDVIFLQDISVPQQTTARDMMLLMATQTKPRPFAVRPNLFAALERLRSKSEDVWIWVDAICINQKDNSEKSSQLPKMPDIYRNAWNVTIWIGDWDVSPYQAMDFLPSILNLKLLDRLVDGEGHDEETLKAWVRFANILKRPWFSRRWVVQEIAFANRASVQCGSQAVSWLDFSDAVELFMRKLDRIRILYDASELSRYDPDALNNVESAGAQTMISTTNSMLKKTEDGTVLEYSWDLESLVMQLTSFAASNVRDTIYAFCALAKDGLENGAGSKSAQDAVVGPIVPQYTKSIRDVYMEFVEYCVKITGSLDILCRYWALPEPRKAHAWPDKLPSWIGLVGDSSFGPPSGFTGRINGDSLVGQPGARTYNASLNRVLHVSFPVLSPSDSLEQLERKPMAFPGSMLFDFSASDDLDPSMPSSSTLPPSEIPRSLNGELHARGIILHRITETSSRVVDGTISDDGLRVLGWHRQNKTFNDIPDQIWRTLVANRGPGGKHVPMWYKRACAYALKKTSAEGDLNTSKLISNKALPESVFEYLRRVQAIVWSKKFFTCESSSHCRQEDTWRSYGVGGGERLYGIGSRKIEAWDLVCILFGCSVPVILRRSERPPNSAAKKIVSADTGETAGVSLAGTVKMERVTFVGEGYVHGKMDGEALMGMDEAILTAQTVDFVIT